MIFLVLKTSKEFEIRKYLVLNKYFLSLLGVKDILDLAEQLKNIKEGIGENGLTNFYQVISRLSNIDGEVSNKLEEYDRNITDYVKKINANRHSQKISLKYFQYLAVLFSEILFDNLTKNKNEFIAKLNQFLTKYKKQEGKISEIIPEFNENDLKKFAFWMATGAGKTIIMHINYYQFLKYRPFEPENIILITPNEGMTKQHAEELKKSGIAYKIGSEDMSGKGNYIRIYEITKLVETKEGRGKTVEVSAFVGKNFVLVDEGHKGRKSEDKKWINNRNKLIENGGLTLEYSATFGQILNEEDSDTLSEYAKAILFDYSYKYFYLDGYGKDFKILNQEKAKGIIKEDVIFIANLLSFYEQIDAYLKNEKEALLNNIQKPLWTFVGTTVYKETSKEISDVSKIVQFISKFLTDKNWAANNISNILSGRFVNEKNEDIFSDEYSLFRDYYQKYGTEVLMGGIYKTVFNGIEPLKLYIIKNSPGEIGLKSGDEYFGVINIGDVSSLKKNLIENKILNEEDIREDSISASLFDSIKEEDSRINVLIGARKFAEGWDTWRVSSIGLLNIGKGQGPLIIQLFGRGVRLKGKDMSLKRADNPDQILSCLETLKIFGINANYLKAFLGAINKEIEVENVKIPVIKQHTDKWFDLYTLLKIKTEEDFKEEKTVLLSTKERLGDIKMENFNIAVIKSNRKIKNTEYEESIKTEKVKVNYRPLSVLLKEEQNYAAGDLINLSLKEILIELIKYKLNKQYYNLVINEADIKKIIFYTDIIKVEYEGKEYDDFKNFQNLKEIVVQGLKNYVDKVYRHNLQKFETENLKYEKLSNTDPLKAFSATDEVSSDRKTYYYNVAINAEDRNLVTKIKELAQNIDKLIGEKEEENNYLPRIYFDRHLYLPILLYKNENLHISPTGLNESEADFLFKLREYVKSKPNIPYDIYIIRNFPKSGVGFTSEGYGFYPDFIMWLKDHNGQTQYIVLIDPKGLTQSTPEDEKLNLYKKLKEIENKLDDKNLHLDSFIFSKTNFEDLKKKGWQNEKDSYTGRHILFLEDGIDAIRTMISLILEGNQLN